MIRSSEDWLLRALIDWVLNIKQGLALITYTSFPARQRLIERLASALTERGLTLEVLQCEPETQEHFLKTVARGTTDVLLVLSPQRLLFGEKNEHSPGWINFYRETIVSRPGAQIWCFPIESIAQFSIQLPDLNRFFLFREDLVSSVEPPTTSELQPIEIKEREQGSNALAQLLLEKALQAAKGPAPHDRIWLELAIPALREFTRLDHPQETLAAFHQLIQAIGEPREILAPPTEETSLEVAQAMLTLGKTYTLGLSERFTNEARHEAERCFLSALKVFNSSANDEL